MYAKIFTQIFDSTIAADWQVRHVFEDFLKLADENGVVDMPLDSIVRRANMPEEIIKRAILVLESPDPQSRTPDHEGRRLLRLYDDKDWGWVIANHDKYRSITNREELKRQGRIRTAKFRSRGGKAIAEPVGYVYYALCSELNEIKIGFSVNPWSRLKELRTARPNLEIVATEQGTRTTETTRHESFSEFRKNREWFTYSVVIKNFVESLKNEEIATTNVTTALPTETVATTAPQKQKQKQSTEAEREGGSWETRTRSVQSDRKFPEVEVPSWQEVQVECQKIGLVEWRAKDWFDEMQQCGWKDNKNREVMDWRAYLARVRTWWERDGRPPEPTAKANGRNSVSNDIKNQSALVRVEDRLKVIRGQFPLCDGDPLKDEFKELKVERERLKKLLGFKA